MISKNGLIKKVYDLSDSFKHASAAILFGSIARGDYDSRSDIDVLLIYSDERKLEMDKDAFDGVSPIEGREVHIVARTLDELERSDRVFLRNVFREGIVLFVREPMMFKASEMLGLKAFRIYTYTMRNLDVSEKKRLISTLYGYSTRKVTEGKEYAYSYKGVVDVKLGKNCFLVEENKVRQVEELFKKYNVQYRSINVWIESQTGNHILKP